MRRPGARIGLVLVVGTCLWAMTGRREKAQDAIAATPAAESAPAAAATQRPPVSIGVRRLPQRMLSRPVDLELGAVHADFDSQREAPGEIHAASFTVEVSANAPAWLTGEIEVE